MKEWFSARELAGKPGMANGVDPINRKAKRNAWQSRPRNSRGGGLEYHVSSLPEETRRALAEEEEPVMPVPVLPLTDGTLTGEELGARLRQETETTEQRRREAKERGLADFGKLPAPRRTEAEARHELLLARDFFLEASGLPKKRGTEMFAAEIRAGRTDIPGWVRNEVLRKGSPSLSWSTLCRWELAYQEGGIAGLAGKYAPIAGARILPVHQNLIIGMMVQFPTSGPVKVMAALEARHSRDALPSESAVRRFMAAWKEQNASAFLYLTNPDEWKSRHMFAFGDADEQVTRLNQLWELDSTPGDVMLTDGRHAVIGVIDVFSRRTKHLVTPTSRATAIAALFRRAVLDWGVPETVKTDQGQDYTSRHLVRILDNLGVQHLLCRPFSPEQKPHIERALQTMSHGIVELLPGYVGHNVVERKAIEARRTFADRLMSKGETVEVPLTAAQFQAVLDRWTEAVYHQNPHRGLEGKTPAEVARAWTEPVRRITDERALDLLLSPAPKEPFRTIQKKGISVDGAWFVAPELAGHEGERVQVLLDVTDLGAIHLFRAEGEYLCTARNGMAAGVDRAEVAARAKRTQMKIVRETRKELRRVAAQVAVETIHEEILGHRESKIVKVREFPKVADPHLTDALTEAARAVADRDRATSPVTGIAMTPEEEAKAAVVMALNYEERLPANDYEKYELLLARGKGRPLTDAERQWVTDYEAKIFPDEQRAQSA